MDEYDSYLLEDCDVRSNVKVLLLYPIAPPGQEEGPFPASPRDQLLSTTQVDEVYCLGAPSSYEGPGDAEAVARVSPLVAAKVQWAESEGYDAVVIGCTKDLGLSEAKRSVGIPVLEIGETIQAIGSLLGESTMAIASHDISRRNQENQHSEVSKPLPSSVDIGLKMAELLATLNVRPEQPWVASRRSSKLAQLISRMAWRVRSWIPRP